MTHSLLHFVYIGNAELQDDLPWTGKLYTCQESALMAARDIAWKRSCDATVVSIAAHKEQPGRAPLPVPTAASIQIVTHQSAKEHYKDRTRGLKQIAQ